MENLPFFRASQTLGAEVSTDAKTQKHRHSQHLRKIYSGLNNKKAALSTKSTLKAL